MRIASTQRGAIFGNSARNSASQFSGAFGGGLTRRPLLLRLPNVLALHLKRFKYVESLDETRLPLSFPMELSVENVVNDGAAHAGRTSHLFAVVVHLGSGPNHGHYVSLVRSHNKWLLFDDESVELIKESAIEQCFGTLEETGRSTDTGYILFYQSDVWD